MLFKAWFNNFLKDLVPRRKLRFLMKQKKNYFASSQLAGVYLVVLTQKAHQAKHKYRDNFLSRQILQHQFSWRTRLITKHYSSLKVTRTAGSFTRHQLCIFWSQSKHIPSFLPSPATAVSQQCWCHWLHWLCISCPLIQKGDAYVQCHKNIITWEHLQHSEKCVLYHFTLSSSIN